MPKLKYWAVLSGSAWMAAAAFVAADLMMTPEAYANWEVSFAVMAAMLVLFSFLSASPATFVASILEPVVRAMTPPHGVRKAMACALGGGLAGYLTPLFVDVIRNMEPPNGHDFRRARPGVPAGKLGGALVFGFGTRGAARG